MAEEFSLEMLDITKTFPGVVALDGVDLRVRTRSAVAMFCGAGPKKKWYWIVSCYC